MNKIKEIFQRIVRGYSDKDIKQLNIFILNKVYDPFKAFIEEYEQHGLALPKEFSTDPGEWLTILKKIEFSLDYLYDCNYDEGYKIAFHKNQNEEQKLEHRKQIKEGLRLFGEHFINIYEY
ncbi:MAG: hypothetical protein WCX46_04050 [Candidatus Paceibacterota bacterium]